MPGLSPHTNIAGRYKLVQLLGIGGNSEVWKAIDNMAGEMLVALKIFAPGKGLDSTGIKVFSSEYSLVFNLSHSGLLQAKHYDIWEGSPYLVMTFCANGSVYGKIGEMTETEVLHFIQQAAAALDYLHNQPTPIIHQDIKPDNFLISDLGNYLLSDFGISSRLRRTLTRSVGNEGSAGTMAYLPPERFTQNKQVLPAGDIFALGVTAYELLSGDLPFDDQGGLRLKNGADIPDLPQKFNPALNALIRSCLNADPSLRPDAKRLGINAIELSNSFKSGTPTPSQPKTISEVRKTVQIPIPATPTVNDIIDKNHKDKKYSILKVIILVVFGLAFFFMLITNLEPSQKERLAKAIADSTALADSVAVVVAERQRVSDSISEAVNKIGSSIQIVLNSNEEELPEKPTQKGYSDLQQSEVPKTNKGLSIGQQYAGGIIFYIDKTGQHGLVCATYDQNSSVAWRSNAEKSLSNGPGVALYSGKSNTSRIFNSQGYGNYAAIICYDLTFNGYSDWYLPSIDELILMYENLKLQKIGGFVDGGYWSSSEVNSDEAYVKEFRLGYSISSKKFEKHHVRAARTF